MNKHKKLMGIYLIPILIATVAAVTLRTVALFTEFNIKNGHFDGKALIVSANVITLFFAVFALSYLFVGSKDNLVASFCTPSTYVPSGLVSVCLLFLGVSLGIYGLSGFTPDGFISGNLQYPLALIIAFLTVPAAIHFFLNAYFTDIKNEIRATFSLFTVLFFAMYAAFLYFNRELALNAPNKIVDQMAFLFSALFFLYEARISLGREVWRGYIAFGMVGVVLCAYSSVPSLILYFAKSTEISNSMEENLLLLSVFIFISFRLFLTMTLRAENDDGGVLTLEKYATERQAHVNEVEEVYKDAFAIQMTIADLGAYDEDGFLQAENGDEATEDGKAELETEEPDLNLTFDFDLADGSVLVESDNEEDTEES